MQELSEKLTFTLDQELGGDAGGAVPDVVQVLPSGKVDPKGKTSFVVDEEAKGLILSAFEKCATDLVVDYEHQSLSGSEAPAAGWIKGLDDRGEDGLWAKVQWTERAVGYLKNREYRYLSPVVLIRKKDCRAVELLGAALTNLPAIDGMKPVVNTVRPLAGEEVTRLEDKYRDMYKEVLKLVDLPEDSGIEEVRARVEAISSIDGYVPLHEHEALKETIKIREAEAVVKEALTAGRLTPALMPWARVYAMRDPEGFAEFMSKAGPAVPFGTYIDEKVPSIGQAQRTVNGLLGVSDALFLRCGHPAEAQ